MWCQEGRRVQSQMKTIFQTITAATEELAAKKKKAKAGKKKKALSKRKKGYTFKVKTRAGVESSISYRGYTITDRGLYVPELKRFEIRDPKGKLVKTGNTESVAKDHIDWLIENKKDTASSETAVVFPEGRYVWFAYTGKPHYMDNAKGRSQYVDKGTVFGVRPATSKPDTYRVIFKDLGPSHIFSVDQETVDFLVKKAKPAKVHATLYQQLAAKE